MDKKDVDKLFHLLSQYYPNAKQLRNPDTKLAWALALKQYTYDDIRAAAVEHGAHEKFFPDIADLTKRCSTRQEMVVQRMNVPPCLIRDVRLLEEMEPLLNEMELLMEQDYISAGVPHPSAARKMGWTPEQWVRECGEKLGVDGLWRAN